MPEKSHTSVTETRNIPDALKVPDGEALLLHAYGKGVQIYTCTAGAAGDTSPGTFTGPVPMQFCSKTTGMKATWSRYPFRRTCLASYGWQYSQGQKSCRRPGPRPQWR